MLLDGVLDHLDTRQRIWRKFHTQPVGAGPSRDPYAFAAMKTKIGFEFRVWFSHFDCESNEYLMPQMYHAICVAVEALGNGNHS